MPAEKEKHNGDKENRGKNINGEHDKPAGVGEISQMSTKMENKYPSPDNLVEFLPWACRALMFEFDVQVDTAKQHPLPKEDKSRGPNGKRSKSSNLSTEKSSSVIKNVGAKSSVVRSNIKMSLAPVPLSSQGFGGKITTEPNMVYITLVLDANDRVVELKMLQKDRNVPGPLVKLFALVLPFHLALQSITIASRVTYYTINQISQFLPTTRISEICLDGVVLENANCELLLDCGQLKCLSLRQCRIRDKVVKSMTSKLSFKMSVPMIPHYGLSVLNLASNFITDNGAKYLAEVLRSNRSLCYLNLSGNQITDEGGISILNALVSFEMSFDEIYTVRKHMVQFIVNKRDLVEQITMEMLSKPGKDKKKPNKVSGRSTKTDTSDFFAKVEEVVTEAVGVFDAHPFSKVNIWVEDGTMYCKGNNRMAFLSLNYNNLTLRFLKKLHSVLMEQASDARHPKGLTNVSIEGNLFPNGCPELELINFMLQVNITRKVSIKTSKPATNRSR